MQMELCRLKLIDLILTNIQALVLEFHPPSWSDQDGQILPIWEPNGICTQRFSNFLSVENSCNSLYSAIS